MTHRTPARLLRPRRIAAIAGIVGLACALPGSAIAAWLASGDGSGRARAVSLPAGDTPGLTVVGRSVELTWSEATFPDGTPVEGYVVTRYDVADVPDPAGGGCAGVVTTTTCTESATPPGTWTYTVQPAHANWTGPEGPASISVDVAGPALGWDVSSAIASLPVDLTGTIDGFVGGEVVTFRLDDPVTGLVLAATVTPNPVAVDGTAQVTVTIPGGLADGTHQVHAVGDGGSVAGAPVTVDATAPTITSATIAKKAGGVAGRIRNGGTYRVYANATDAISGMRTVTADVSAITTGVVALPLSKGTWTIDGVTYGYRSATVTAGALLLPGTANFTVTATDLLWNASAPDPHTVVIDTTKPSGVDVQASNGGVADTPDAGDTMTLTHSELMEPVSLIAGWTGAPTAVTVRIVQVGSGDRLEVWNAANTSKLGAFGSVRLGSTAYVTSTVSFTGSTVSRAGDTLTLVLGTPNGTTNPVATAKMRWNPGGSSTDLAGNGCLTTSTWESGPDDADF